MSINRRTYPPMSCGASWPNADAPESCYAETSEERAAIERLNVLTRKYGRAKAEAIAVDEARLVRMMKEEWT
jgi:hypothetical protein